jgi:hypothetical protein
MELSKQSYDEVISMPYTRFVDYIKWKTELENEKEKKYADMTSGVSQ